MPLLDDDVRNEVQRRFESLDGDVRLMLFTPPDGDGDGHGSEELRELLAEVAALSPRVAVEEHTLGGDDPTAAEHDIRRAPAVAVRGERDYGIRYYGPPGGYEFESLIDVIGDVARGDAEVPEQVRSGLAEIREPVHVQVFVTPT